MLTKEEAAKSIRETLPTATFVSPGRSISVKLTTAQKRFQIKLVQKVKIK